MSTVWGPHWKKNARLPYGLTNPVVHFFFFGYSSPENNKMVSFSMDCVKRRKYEVIGKTHTHTYM